MGLTPSWWGLGCAWVGGCTLSWGLGWACLGLMPRHAKA